MAVFRESGMVKDPDCWYAESVMYMRKNKACQYQQLAHHYLCICATSVPSERVFSAGGNIVTNSLKPARVDQLVFLVTNLK